MRFELLSVSLPPVARLFCLSVLLALAGCADSSDPPATSSAATAKAIEPMTTVVDPALWPQASSPLAADPALEARVSELLATMSIEEKVGQIVQGDLGSVTPADIRTYRLGSVLAGGNSDPGGRYNAPAADWLALMDEFHRAAMDTSEGRKAIPLLLGIDAVHGHNNVVGATLYPHNIGLGAAHDSELVRRIAQATAKELRATGFDWTFAPTLTVPRDDRWGRTYEGYSEDPARVAGYAAAVVEGLQGRAGTPEFLDGSHVLASAKHFIGDGGTEGGKDQGDTRVSEADLRDIHGAGYLPAIQAGTQTVMASFSSWNGSKIHGHRGLLTDVLKGRMGFDGFVIGDWNAHGQLPGCSNENCAAAFNAGVDMLMAPDSWRGYYTNAVAQVREGTIPMQRLDEAVRRILRVKFRLGLFEAGLPSERPLGGRFDLLGHPEHRALAREAVRKSLVLLKNNGGLLPLQPGSRVLVAGDAADDLGKQAGGWTLSWQGDGNQRADFPGAQSIWEAVRAATEAAGGQAQHAPDGSFSERPDVAIVVFGEAPYAEFRGDIANLRYRPGNDRDLDLMRALKAKGIPVVAVFLSGRPLWVNREINAADAFVAAWLPGSEGGGVADVLFKSPSGQVLHDFRGRLSFSWPRRADQSPLNVGQADYDPLFAIGHGLDYAHPQELAVLAEDSGLEQAAGEPGEYFARGSVAAGMTLLLADGDEQGTPVNALPNESIGQRLRVTAIDHLAQEDARRFVWSGRGLSRLLLRADAPIDLSAAAAAGQQLVITLRVDQAAAEAIPIDQRCAAACAGSIDIGPLLNTVPRASWTRVGLPLDCLRKAGADLALVTRLVDFQASSALDISISRIALGSEFDHALSCTDG